MRRLIVVCLSSAVADCPRCATMKPVSAKTRKTGRMIEVIEMMIVVRVITVNVAQYGALNHSASGP